MEHLADLAPRVQILDAPVPQTEEELVHFFEFLGAQRLVDYLRPPQMAEQLTEVPTVLTLSSLQQQTVEQIVDFRVPLGRGRRFQGSLSEQDTTAFGGADHIDTPVPRGGLHDFLPDPGASSAVSLDELGQGVFRTFPRSKKVRMSTGR